MDFEEILEKGLLGLGMPSTLPRIPIYFGSVFSTKMEVTDLTKDGEPVLPVLAAKKGLIRMSINPNSVGFSQPKRITERYTVGGKTFTHWSDSEGYDNDLLTLRFAGVTGSLDPRDASSALRHLAWAKLHDLTAEKMLDEKTGRKNYAFCFFESVSVPFQVLFVGHFPAVMDFSEKAGSPFNKDYSFEFVVEAMTPSLNRIQDHISTKLLTPAILNRLSR